MCLTVPEAIRSRLSSKMTAKTGLTWAVPYKNPGIGYKTPKVGPWFEPLSYLKFNLLYFAKFWHFPASSAFRFSRASLCPRVGHYLFVERWIFEPWLVDYLSCLGRVHRVKSVDRKCASLCPRRLGAGSRAPHAGISKSAEVQTN